ncbi:FecR family protein [Calycomorphotria hydatis]|nr:hypothetical protein [Calycomorphotria hydatis]
MTASPDEFESLLAAVMNSTATATEIERLNTLVASNNSLAFTAINHSEVAVELRQSVNTSDTVELILAADRRQGRSQSRRRTFIQAAIGSVVAAAILLTAGITAILYSPAPPDAGKLVGLTTDAEWSGKEYTPGNLIQQQRPLTLESGIATIELNGGAIVSVEGPATVELINAGKASLISGLLHAVVPPRAIGFVVQTIDAEVVDLGTEFTVDRSDEFGTRVLVKRGLIEARTMPRLGDRGSVHELTAGRGMEFDIATGTAKELANIGQWSNQFERFENARGGIARIDGIVRTTPALPADLRHNALPTNDYMILVRECAGIEIMEDLIIEQPDGAVTLEAGTLVDSYLIHFDPEYSSTAPPVGVITFSQPILAVASRTEDLNSTDNLCAVNGSRFTNEDYRGLEANHDQYEVTSNRKTLSFRFLRTAPVQMDQCRILVRHSPGDDST